MNPSTATTSGGALQNLQQFQSGMQNPDQLLQKEQQGLGTQAAQQQVQGLQGAINNTTNLLNQVAPSVQGRTQNSLVTSGQANQLINNEQAPIQQQLGQDTTAYNTANSNYTNLEGQAENLANADLTGQTNQQSYLQGIYNDLYTQEQNQATQQAAQAQAAAQEQQFQQSLAEQAREANQSSATARATTPSLVGGSSTGGVSGALAKNAVGGYSFTNGAGVPVTMAQYLAGNGYSTASDIASGAAQLLAQGSSSDKAIAAAINSGKYSPAQLAQLYPQVFGGSF